MGVQKTIIQEGNGPVAQKGQKVSIEYTGWLKDTSKPDNKGKQLVEYTKPIDVSAGSSC
jgi:FK506-binding protein 1